MATINRFLRFGNNSRIKFGNNRRWIVAEDESDPNSTYNIGQVDVAALVGQVKATILVGPST